MGQVREEYPRPAASDETIDLEALHGATVEHDGERTAERRTPHLFLVHHTRQSCREVRHSRPRAPAMCAIPSAS